MTTAEMCVIIIAIERSEMEHKHPVCDPLIRNHAEFKIRGASKHV